MYVCMYVLTDPTILPSGSQSLWQLRQHNCCYIMYIFLTDQWGGGLRNTLRQSSANVILRYMKHINSITQSELLHKPTKIYNSPSALVLLSRDKVVKARSYVCKWQAQRVFNIQSAAVNRFGGSQSWKSGFAQVCGSERQKCFQCHSASSGYSPLTLVQKDGT